MTVGYVWRVQKDLVRQMSFGFDSCVREVDALLATSSPATTKHLAADAGDEADVEMEIENKAATGQHSAKRTRSNADVDDRLRAQLIGRLYRCAAGLRRAAAASAAAAAVQTSAAAAGKNVEIRANRPFRTTSLSPSVDVGLHHNGENSRWLFADMPMTRHSVGPSIPPSAPSARPLKDVNGNHRLHLLQNDDRKLITSTTKARTYSENVDFRFATATSCRASATMLSAPLTSSAFPSAIVSAERFPIGESSSFRYSAEVGDIVHVDEGFRDDDDVASNCSDGAALDFSVRSSDEWRRHLTCDVTQMSEEAVVKTEPSATALSSSDMWRPW